MLVSVVDKGFDKARIKGYDIAGKTGTAQVFDPITKRYSVDRTIQSFIGFAPLENPRFVMLTKLTAPKIEWAESSVAPLFKTIGEFLLNYLKVPPSYQIEK